MSRRHLRRHWERHAATDPLWAVAAAEERRGRKWDEAAFFDSGRREVATMLARLERLGLHVQHGRALDFGCGVGRLSQALAERFGEVHGIDIAPTMIDLARRYNRHGDRCRYRVAESEALPFPDRTFDLVYSILVLQHMPPATAKRSLREMARVVAPGGALVFQEAAEPRALPGDDRAGRRLVAAVKGLLPPPLLGLLRQVRYSVCGVDGFEMYGVPRRDVEEIVTGNGLRLVEVVPDEAAGEGWSSFSYVATTRS